MEEEVKSFFLQSRWQSGRAGSGGEEVEGVEV